MGDPPYADTATSAAPRLPAERILEVAVAALRAAGATASDAAMQAEHLLEGELRGHPSHGMRRLPILVERVRRGLIVSGIEPVIRAQGDGALVVDGALGFGPVVVDRTLKELLPRAERSGIAIALLRRTHHLGMLAPYLDRMTAGGFIGIVLTTSEGLVHPWGGRGAIIGTNPLGIGVPNGDAPVTLDMSTGSTSAGKVRDYAQRDRPLEEGWAVDALGHPTTDARAALDGAISPFGGAKGYALGVTLGALVGLATGSEYGEAVAGTLDSEHPVTKGDVIIAISVATLESHSEQGLVAYLDEVRGSGVDGGSVTVPGDRSRRERADNLEHGVSIDATTWAAALRLAEGQ